MIKLTNIAPSGYFQELSTGRFGRVMKAFDHKYQTFVGVKILPYASPESIKLADNEGMLLDMLRNYDLVAKRLYYMYGSLVYRNHKCIVVELLGSSLAQLMKVMNHCRIGNYFLV